MVTPHVRVYLDGDPQPLIDVNMARVLERFFGPEGRIVTQFGGRARWSQAEMALTFNKAIHQQQSMLIEAPTGMNAVAQARAFHDAMQLTGIVLTKLDGTSRGGTILAIEAELDVPVKLVGMGEGIDDLNVFDPTSYLDALFAGVLDVPVA